jgi:transcriptional regulator with XRE-family HTH domain
MVTLMASAKPVGALLREWRQHRRLSQLELACEAEVSTRHISFMETSRSQPSREMILLLAERLHVPLRARNTLLTAGGYAPVFPERRLDDPDLAAADTVIQLVLRSHEPYPAIAIDRYWNLIAANQAIAPLLKDVDESLLTPPVNVLRLSLHAAGLAPRILNFSEWRSHLLFRLQEQIEATADPILNSLYAELMTYPAPGKKGSHRTVQRNDPASIAVPLRLQMPSGTVSMISTTMVFGTPLDVTLSEIAIECFFPAEEASAAILRSLSS